MKLNKSTFFGVALAYLACGGASGATLLVGPNGVIETPCKAFSVAEDGDVIEIEASTYSGDVCAIRKNNLTIRGINGRPKIDAAGKNALGKATWVVAGNDIVIDNVEMTGSKVRDKNGAALRLEGNNFTLRNSFIHGNENGILSGKKVGSIVTLENNEFGYNGYGDGYSHNVYIGQVAKLIFRFNFSHDTKVGHNLKTRALYNMIAYNRFSSMRPDEAGSTGAGKPSYEINVPNGGTTYVIGNIIMQPTASNNPILLSYGEEGIEEHQTDLYVVNNTFVNDEASRGTFVVVSKKVATPAKLINNLFVGFGDVTNQESALQRTNFQWKMPRFVNRQAYELRPFPNSFLRAPVKSFIVDAGSPPGESASGFPLQATSSYKHIASGSKRPTLGKTDIGAYEIQ
jgi:hypothetical protein